MFDGVSLNDHGFGGSPALPPLNLGQADPSNLEGTPTYEQLLAANTNLRTRVSELEVINMVYSDNENNLRNERDNAVRERDDLKRKVEELERQLAGDNGLPHPNKKQKFTESPGRMDE